MTGVTVSKVDENRRPIPGTEIEFECDTLLLSVGLIPENELTIGAGVDISPATSGAVVDDSLQTSVPGIFACGNVLHVHDLVDFVSGESFKAGQAAADYVQGKAHAGRLIPVRDGAGVRGAVPQQIRLEKGAEHAGVDIMFRPDRVYQNPYVVVTADGKPVFSQKKMIMAPGEMANITLNAKQLAACEDAQEIVVGISMEKPAV